MNDSDVVSFGEKIEGRVREAPAEEAAEEEDYVAAAVRAIVGIGYAIICTV